MSSHILYIPVNSEVFVHPPMEVYPSHIPAGIQVTALNLQSQHSRHHLTLCSMLWLSSVCPTVQVSREPIELSLHRLRLTPYASNTLCLEPWLGSCSWRDADRVTVQSDPILTKESSYCDAGMSSGYIFHLLVNTGKKL